MLYDFDAIQIYLYVCMYMSEYLKAIDTFCECKIWRLISCGWKLTLTRFSTTKWDKFYHQHIHILQINKNSLSCHCMWQWLWYLLTMLLLTSQNKVLLPSECWWNDTEIRSNKLLKMKKTDINKMMVVMFRHVRKMRICDCHIFGTLPNFCIF